MKLNMRTEWHFNSPLKEAFVHLFLLLSIGALASFLTYFLIMLEWGPEKYENSTYFKCMGKEHNGVLDEDCNSDNVVDSTSFLHWIHIAKTNHRVWGVIQDRNYDDIPDWKEVLLTFNYLEILWNLKY